jgi:hypothetical protein
MRHGQDEKFSCEGVEIAVRYWTGNGHPVICFLPEYLFNINDIGKKKRLNNMGLKTTKAQKLPDKPQTLIRLEKDGIMVRTPA